jgi:hypothetical protein
MLSIASEMTEEQRRELPNEDNGFNTGGNF